MVGRPAIRAKAIYDYLVENGQASLSELRHQFGASRQNMNYLVRTGVVSSLSKGMYAPSEIVKDRTPAENKMAVLSQESHAIFLCLHTAAYLQGLTTEDPRKVYIMARQSDRNIFRKIKKIGDTAEFPVECISIKDDAIDEENCLISGQWLDNFFMMTNPARTVVDLLRASRMKDSSGEALALYDIAVEAFHRAMRQGITTDQLHEQANIIEAATGKNINKLIEPLALGHKPQWM
jgi:hypothetical protein